MLTASGAPRGSIYHHFPDGKRQLAQEAVRWTSERVLAYQAGYTRASPAGVPGLPAERAGAIATATLAGMEGALILCRAEAGVGPLDIVARELLRLLPAETS